MEMGEREEKVEERGKRRLKKCVPYKRNKKTKILGLIPTTLPLLWP